jgi:hypothetical protein
MSGETLQGALEPPGVDRTIVGPPSGTGPQLSRMIESSTWTYRSTPFAHIHVKNVFVPVVYDQLQRAFRDIVTISAKDQPAHSRLTYLGDTFDGYIMAFRPDLTGALALFMCKAWVDLLARATGVEVTRDVNGALHVHAVRSKNGFVHKDYSSCWFIDQPRPDGINVSDNNICHYRTGHTPLPYAMPQERVRAVAMIFYLNNAPWSEGDGGETGLYADASDLVDQPTSTIPPLNNSMLVFECTPRSYHSFMSNRVHPRSSIAMWLHRTKEEAIGRWGADSIVYVRE